MLGVALGALFGVAVAIFLTQDFFPRWLEITFKNIIELLAAIPSVVYGLWGIFVVIPLIRPPCNWLHEHLGWIPIFGTPLLSGRPAAGGAGAGDHGPADDHGHLARRPRLGAAQLREAAFGLGATRWETILGVILPTSKRGIYGSIVLGFGRALGETMALAMLVGNANVISLSLFSPANTLAACWPTSFPKRPRRSKSAC